ncbi:hypothetical protein BU23DRAFT_457248 [Bimuria novae-zelandiae CBS 107.79]|uniref:Uncharacterized protein n=1 Tax=Bimuria novae-zelandiae CBS 107.79 TaxID=1447943 RepID=A0A6A5VFF5_9PLEO|nr:hypothetical protein BU23DRAFT_457248 [Bimuria novae-zelandiae CBS 107.79]
MHVKQILLAAVVATVVKSEVHNIDVGEDGLKFEPQVIKPVRGDAVVFHFYPKHNVVSTTFDKPCEYTSGSFFSGPFDKTDNGKLRFVVNVTNEDPVWYYCAVPKHCQQGMVGAWNPPANSTIEAFADAAKKVSDSTFPSSESGGLLLDEEQVASLTQSGASPTESGR